jgi:hypothetical protein
MLSTLHVAIDSYTKAIFQAIFGSVRGYDGAVSIDHLGAEKEYIGASVLSQGIQMLEHIGTNSLSRCIHDQMHVNVHIRAALRPSQISKQTNTTVGRSKDD